MAGTPKPLPKPGGARPSSLPNPVPPEGTEDDLLAALEAMPAPQQPSGSETDELIAALNAMDTRAGTPGQQALNQAGITPESTTKQVLQTAGQVMDFPGGVVRTAGAGAIGMLPGVGQPVTQEDLMATLQGKAPSSAEYLKRMGLSEGPSVEIPKLGRVSLRDAEGFALDIASDPLTGISKLIKKAPYIGKLINAPGVASEAVGKAIYDSAFSAVDAKLASKGKGAISALMRGEGEAASIAGSAGKIQTGTAASLNAKAQVMADAMGNLREGLYTKANELGVTIDMGFPLKRAEAILTKMRRNPGLAPVAEDLAEVLGRYKQAGKVDIATLSDWKTELYEALPASAFGPHGQLKGQASHFKKALAADFREAIVGAGNKAERGLGDAINTLNEDWGILITARKPMTQAASGASKLGKQIDASMLALGGLKGYAVKKSMDLATGTHMRTLIGKALIEGARNGMIDAATRRALIQSQRTSPTDAVTQDLLSTIDRGD